MKTQPIFRSLMALAILLGIIWSCKKEDAVPAKSTAKDISTFAFGGISPAVNGTISGTSISATVPFSVDVTNLAPTIALSPKATVSPASGSAQNFSNPVIYTVTAEDGTNQKYTVTVTKSVAPKSSAKDITKFSFAALSPAVDATIDATAKTISATLPAATDLTKLVPTITISDKATVSPASGVATDFSKEVSYTVTAEDASTQVWKVNVKKEVVTVEISDVDPLPINENSSDAVYFVNGTGDLSAVDMNTQKEKWRFPSAGSGFSGLPTISNGIVYAPYQNVLFAFDSETGKEKWRVKLDKTPYYSFGNPRVDGGMVYIGNEGTIYAFDAISGKKIWDRVLSQGFSSTLVAENGVVYVSAGGKYGSYEKMYAFDGKTGEQKWVNNTGLSWLVYYNGFLFGTNESKGGLFAVNASTGIQKWVFNYSSYYGKYNLTISKGIIYSGDDSKYFAINVNTGKEIWKNTVEKFATFNSVVFNGTLFVNNGNDKKIHAYNALTGTEKWVSSINNAYPQIGMIANNDKLFVGTSDLGFYILNPSNGAKIAGFEEILKIRSPGRSFCIVQDKKLYEIAN